MVSVEEAPQKEAFRKRKYSSLVTTLDESACNQHGKESTMKIKLKSHVQPTHGKYENNCDHHAAEALRRAGFKKQKRSFHEEYEAYCKERMERSTVRSTLEELWDPGPPQDAITKASRKEYEAYCENA